MLDVNNLSKAFGPIQAVRDVSFTALPGEVTGYLGPNGAGKTTTIRMLASFIVPDGGSILLDGSDIQENPVAYKRQLGYVPEQAEIYFHLTPEEYLEFVGRLRGMPDALIHKKVNGFLEVFGLSSSRYKLLAEFSKGMRQKILLAGALIHNPRLLLLDEPLSGLDVRSVLLMRDLLPRLAARGQIILFSTHVLEIAEKVCSTVVILHHGRVVRTGPVSEMLGGEADASLEDIFREAVDLEDPSIGAEQLADIIGMGS